MNTRRLTRLITAALAAIAFTFAGHTAETTNKSRTTGSEPARTAKSGKVDLNTADRATLESLPGVGPDIARNIIAARPFSSVSDLEKVSGIGPARMADLRSQVTVSKPVAARSESTKPVAGTSKRDTDHRATSAKVDVNTADRATLEALPGVGLIAGAIIAGRPFTTVNDLELVPGIGPARLAELREHVTVSPHRSATARRDTSRDLEPTGRGTTTPAANRSSRVNLNTATRAELEALPEIGPVKAQAIIDARPFASTKDVMRVKGIKEGTYEVIKDQITVR